MSSERVRETRQVWLKTTHTCPNWHSNWGAQWRAKFCDPMTTLPVYARLFPSILLSPLLVARPLNERIGVDNTVLMVEASCNPVNTSRVAVYIWRKSPFHAVQRDRSRVHSLSQLPTFLRIIWSVSFILTETGCMRKLYIICGSE